ncbi:MAG: amino acid permease [Phycisphaerales bacterium]|nr:amino acid permease [Phycisphaerales bacterium]
MKLIRSFTLVPAAAVIIANIVGTGIFVKTRVMTVNVGSPELVIAVWIAAGLLSLAGAMLYAELSTMMPRSGGQFNFIGAAFGERWAFLFGWTRVLVAGAGSAAVAMLCVIFFNNLMGGGLSDVMMRVLPVVVLLVAVGLNCASGRANGGIATALTAGKILLVLSIAVGAFVFGDGSWSHFQGDASGGLGEGVPESARGGVAGFGAAMLGALWAYNGWNVIVAIGGEVKNPSWTLPRALIGGTTLVIVLYVLINIAYFYILSPLEIADIPESSSIASEVASRFMGAGAAAVLAGGLMISAYGTLHAGILAGPRLPYAMAERGIFPQWFMWLSSRGVPVNGVVAMGLWAIVLTLSGTFDILTDIYVFVLWVFYGLTGAGLFVLRRTHPEYERPYRVWGYPVVPALFLLVTAYLLINTMIATPGRAIAGVVFIVSGLPVYEYFRRRGGGDDRAWLE